jgi:hypothetical protein
MLIDMRGVAWLAGLVLLLLVQAASDRAGVDRPIQAGLAPVAHAAVDADASDNDELTAGPALAAEPAPGPVRTDDRAPRAIVHPPSSSAPLARLNPRAPPRFFFR